MAHAPACWVVAQLTQVLRPQGSGKKVVLVKSDRDGRYSTREVVSHDGLRRVRLHGCVAAARPYDGAAHSFPQQCLALPLLASLHDRLTTAEFEAVDVIAVDEVRCA